MDVFMTIIIGFICLFTVICIHELGHYIAVRAAKVKVLEVGFGIPPRLFAFKRGDTEYSINLFPIGAFVRPEGEQGAMDPGITATPGSLASKSPWVRMGVSAAGPLANVLLAFVLFSIGLMIPMEVIVGKGIIVNEVNQVDTRSPAEEAGILSGDILMYINGEEIRNSKDLRDAINSSEEGNRIEVVLDRDGKQISTYLVPEYDPEEDRLMMGISTYTLLGVMVSQVYEGSPAEAAGIEPRDMIYKVDGKRIYEWEDFSEAMGSIKEGEKVALLLQQGDELNSISLVPDIDSTGQPSIGVEGRWLETYTDSQRYPFFQAIATGGTYIIEFPGRIVDIIRTLGWEPVYKSGGGPIAVFQMTGEVKKGGFAAIVSLAGAISLAIGLFNLFPIPPLDGGGILIAGIEGVRRGKRLSPRAIQIVYAIGAALLFTLFIMLTYNDILRLIRGESIFP